MKKLKIFGRRKPDCPNKTSEYGSDYAAMIYFAALSIVCLYYLFQDIDYLPTLVIAPVFYSVISCYVGFLFQSFPEILKSKGRTGKLENALSNLIAAVIACSIVCFPIFHFSFAETKQNLLCLEGILIIVISLLQTFISAYPFRQKAIPFTQKLKICFAKFTAQTTLQGSYVVCVFVFFALIIFGGGIGFGIITSPWAGSYIYYKIILFLLLYFSFKGLAGKLLSGLIENKPSRDTGSKNKKYFNSSRLSTALSLALIMIIILYPILSGQSHTPKELLLSFWESDFLKKTYIFMFFIVYVCFTVSSFDVGRSISEDEQLEKENWGL